MERRKYGDDMPTLTDNIASWEEEYLLPEAQFQGQDSIATESRQQESAEWEVCVDALLNALCRSWSDSSPVDAPQPNRTAIGAAIAWLAYLRRRFPTAPPTCIVPVPDGGVIVERREKLANGHECVCELTFYNDGHAERTDYYDGRVLQMLPITHQPDGMNC